MPSRATVRAEGGGVSGPSCRQPERTPGVGVEWGWEREDGNGPGSTLSGSGGLAPAPVTLTDSARVLVNPVCKELAGLGCRGRIPWTYKIWRVHACWENALSSEKNPTSPKEAVLPQENYQKRNNRL